MARHHRSPHRHSVRAHTRDGHHIRSYMRGQGSPPRRIRRFRSLTDESSTRKFEEFKISFDYGKGRKEEVTVMARDMDDAMNLALQRRKSKLKPKNAVIRDGVGEFLGKVVGKAVGEIRIGREKYKLETARARERQKELGAMNLAERERFVKRKIRQARLGDREAQIFLERYHIAWETV